MKAYRGLDQDQRVKQAGAETRHGAIRQARAACTGQGAKGTLAAWSSQVLHEAKLVRVL